jgi:hypothetical protein
LIETAVVSGAIVASQGCPRIDRFVGAPTKHVQRVIAPELLTRSSV